MAFFKWSKISVLGIICCFIFSTCQKENNTEVPFVSLVQIPSGLNVLLTHNFIIHDVNGTAFENIISAMPSRASIRDDDGLTNLDIIQHAYLEILTSDSTYVEIAYHENTPLTNQTFLDLFPSIADVSEFITQDTFDIRLRLVFRAIPSNSIDLRIDYGFLIATEL